MGSLSLTTYWMPGADLGPTSPLPAFKPYGNPSTIAHIAAKAFPDFPDKGRENIILPYRTQNGYDRRLRRRAFQAAVLENDFLRATFLLDLGGRLWSLYDKKAQRELLFVNPVFQPANLASRSAWFAGGVEWNVGIFGHCVLTCEPLHAGRVVAPDGRPILRLYEWERARRAPVQIDFQLADDAPILFSYVRLVNPHDATIPMYWWSNIAIPERQGQRVLAPAESAYRHNYTGDIVPTDVPIVEGIDATYTTNVPNAADLYFDIPSNRRPWIAAVQADGAGFVHTSTDRLHGRKMFNWGVSAGGRRWQEFLSRSEQGYLEIQGGLATTQSEYLFMPAHSTWDWAEAFGPLHVPPQIAHGNWTMAWQQTEGCLEEMLPRASLDRQLILMRAAADLVPREILHHGHGWGALEERRRTASGNGVPISAALPFPAETLNDEQRPWLALLDTGALPYRKPEHDPGAFMVQKDWHDLLESAVAAGRGDHWLSWYHLGVMRYYDGDVAGAKSAWEQSIEREPSAWAFRDLAQALLEEADTSRGLELLKKAVRLAPGSIPLICECAGWLLKADRPGEVVSLLKQVSPTAGVNERVRLLKVRAALLLGDPAEAERFFGEESTVADVQEGETSVTEIWYQWQALSRAIKTGRPSNFDLLEQVKAELQPPWTHEFRLAAAPTLSNP